MPTEKEKQENLKEYIREKEKEGIVVLMGSEGLTGMRLDKMVKQPVEGLLYDLNRLPEVIWTFLDDPKWVNDYAVYLVITKLHEELSQMKDRYIVANDRAENQAEQITRLEASRKALRKERDELFNKIEDEAWKHL